MSDVQLDLLRPQQFAAPLPPRSSSTFDLKRALLGALAWIFAAELSRKYAVGGLEMSLVWPPDGIALGLVLAYGRGMIPAIGAGVVAWHMQRGIAIDESLIGAGSLMLALYVVWRLRQWDLRGPPPANPVTASIRFHLVTLLPATAILVAVGSWQYLLSEAHAKSSWVQIVLIMGISELFGILLFSRLTKLLVEAIDRRDRIPRLYIGWWQLWWLISLGVLVSLGSLGERAQFSGISASVRYAVFPLVAWAAFAGRPLFVHIATALAALALLGLTPAELTDSERALLLLDQAVLVVCLAGLGFFASAAMEHRRTMEASLRELSRIDALTGMLNERGLTSHLDVPGVQHLLIGIDVCNIEQIEDLIGMPRARQIEEDIAHLLRAQVPDAPVLARVRDGFFVISLPQRLWGPDFSSQLNQFRQVLTGRRYMLGEQGVRVRVAMSVFDTQTETVRREEILAALTLACRIAGDSDGLGLVAVSEAPDILIRERQRQLSRVEALREALRHPATNATDGTGLWLACQPIRAAQDGHHDLGVEVLLRWSLQRGVPIPPSEFLPLAERHGLMPLVDRWVVEQVVHALAKHTLGDMALEKISINLSGASMSDAQLPDFIAQAIQTSGIPANRFCFEITESANISERSQAVSLLGALRKLGAQTSLDDFGTGLATFDHLKSLPLDFVKIDGSFIRDILTNRVDQRIVMSTCDVARAMGLKTVAEFVETPAQRNLLAAYGVDFVQGYGISKPVPFNEYLALNRQTQDALPA